MKARPKQKLSFYQSCSETKVRRLLSIADNAGWNPGTDGHGREVGSDHRARPYDGTIADRNSSSDDDIGAQPNIIADVYRRIFTRLITNELAKGHAMIGGDDGGAGAEQDVVADRDGAGRRGPNGAKMIDKRVVADLYHFRVLKKGSRGNLDSFTQALQINPRCTEAEEARRRSEGDGLWIRLRSSFRRIFSL